MIPEPQLTYVLEFVEALGSAASDFVIAGAQAMKFTIAKARATKDIDFILNVIGLRKEPQELAEILRRLGYTPVEAARNFQFEKPIPNSPEKMRIEFMAPEEFKRKTDFRVDVQPGIHARSCVGGSIALSESDAYTLVGKLPNGAQSSCEVRVTKPHALMMLKLLALRDRYDNTRGAREARHDREEAQTHAADIVAIVAAQRDPAEFKTQFVEQFQADPLLGMRVFRILSDFFQETTSPGLILYTEHLASNLPMDSDTRSELQQETERGHRIVSPIQLCPEFFALANAVDDCSDWDRNPELVEDYLKELENTRTMIEGELALQFLPAAAFGGASNRADKFVGSAPEAIQKLSEAEAELLRAYLRSKAHDLRSKELRQRFPNALKS